MTESRVITYVEIAGRQVDADKLICEPCNTLWLDTDIDTTDTVVWKATCPKGHTWEFCW